MTVEPPPEATPGTPWVVEASAATRARRTMRLSRGRTTVSVALERCVAGRLAAAYPVGVRDVEITVDGPLSESLLRELLADLAAAIAVVDPGCRRVVYAADPVRPETTAAARAAGFRAVVEVDVPEPVELCVFEPAWVTRSDGELDEVPGS